MVRMLIDGKATLEMSFTEIESVCEEPDLRECEDFSEILLCWEQAKIRYKNI